ncbi:MAG: peptidylprolyl isomerase, partial [Granulosicoccaceae bacterium]
AAEVSEEEQEQRYKQNESRYMRPQQFKVSYIEIDSKVLGEQAEVDDAAVEAEYDSRRDEFATPEQRDASHILLELAEDADQSVVDETLAKAASLLEEVAGGADFAELAKEHSTDLGSAENGGSLGYFGKGAMVESFEQAAFSLAVGELSEPVRSQFGVHIIKLNAIQESKAKPLEEVREQLKAELVEQQVASVFFEKQDVLATESFENGGSLQPASDALGLGIQQSEWFSEESQVGIGQYAQVRAAVLNEDVLSGGLNSAVLEIADNHAIVLRLDESKPEELKPLDEVREQIISELKREKGQATAQEKADALLAAVEGGDLLADAAAAQSIDPTEAMWSKRDNPEIDRAVLARVFSLPRAASGETAWDQIRNANGNPVVLGVSGVRTAEVDEDVPPADNQMLAQQAGNAAFQALQQGMREVAEVSINEKAINPAAE